MVNNELNNEVAILNAIDKRKNDFMNSLLVETEEEQINDLDLDEFNQISKTRNKDGVYKELLNFIDEVNKPIKLNLILQGLLKENRTLTYKMLESKGNLKDFKEFLIKTNSKQEIGEFIIKSVIKDNTLYLMKTVRK
jgi:hypothetical protein